MSGTAMAVSIAALIVWGLDFGIDFTGGSLLEVQYNNGSAPSVNQLKEELSGLNLHSLVVQPTGDKSVILRFQETDEDTHQAVLAKLEGRDVRAGEASTTDEQSGNATTTDAGDQADIAAGMSSAATATIGMQNDEGATPAPAVEELRFDAIGPSIGSELKNKSMNAILLVLVTIILYVAWAFSKVSKPVASWKYGVAAVIALFHDVLITIGVFAILGKFLHLEVNTPFVAAILTVLGYSVNDTIVVFDRIRENLPKSDEDFEGTVNASVNQTIRRSINTSLTTLLVLLAILFMGGATIRDFVLALSVGIFVGTYSSIFLASPLLVVWERIKNR